MSRQKYFRAGIDFSLILLYNVKVITVTETVAEAKAYREAAVGESRKRLPSCENHSRVAGAKITVVSADSLGVTEARID